MPSYERETFVDAPLERVWEFHSGVDGLLALSLPWLSLCVESVTGPNGSTDPAGLPAGTSIELSMRPFDVVPRQHWTSVITHREKRDDRAMFRDRMREGPFAHWVHTHQFVAQNDGTVIRDTIGYRVEGGPIGGLHWLFGPVGLDVIFRYRHRRTAALLS